MRISLETPSARKISSLSPLELLSLCVLIFVVLETSMAQDMTESFLKLMGQPIDLVKAIRGNEDDNNVSVAIVGVFKFVGAVFGVISTLRISSVLIKNALLHVYRNSPFFISQLLSKKVIAEIESSNFINGSDVESGIDDAKSDYKVLESAIGNRPSSQANISSIDWDGLKSSDLYTYLLDISPDHVDFNRKHEELTNQLNDIYKELDNENAIIKFQIASVQPSLISIIKTIKSRYKFGKSIQLSVSFSSGPQTVNFCTNEKIRNSNSTPILLFAAPLSAFVTKEFSDLIDNPSSYFSPVVRLFPEVQQLITIENGNKTPVSHPRVIFYDNSTAEEYKERVYEQLSPFVKFEAVKSYEKYKQLLKGDTQNEYAPLKPGDAIVVWPPLTDFFIGRKNGEGHFVRNGIDGIDHSHSQIMLFSDKSILNVDSSNKNERFAQLLVKLILFEMRKMKQNYKGVFGFWYKHFLTAKNLHGYKDTFVEMVK